MLNSENWHVTPHKVPTQVVMIALEIFVALTVGVVDGLGQVLSGFLTQIDPLFQQDRFACEFGNGTPTRRYRFHSLAPTAAAC